MRCRLRQPKLALAIAVSLWKSVCPIYFCAAHRSSPPSAKILGQGRFASETRRPEWRRDVQFAIRSYQPPVGLLGHRAIRAFIFAAAF